MIRFSIAIFTILFFSSCSVPQKQAMEQPSYDKIIADHRDKTREVVAVLPLSGPNKEIGRNLKNMIDFAIFKENADIAVKYFDSEKEINKAARFIDSKKIEFVLGPITSVRSAELKSRISTNPIILSYSNDELVAGDNLYVLGINPIRQVYEALDHVKDQGYNRLYIIAPRNEMNQKIVANIKKYYDDIIISKIEFYNQKSFGFAKKSIIQVLKSAHKDQKHVLLILSNHAEFLSIIEGFISNGADITKFKIIGSNQHDDFNDNELEIVKDSIFFGINDYKHQDLYQEYHNVYHIIPEKISLYGYEMVEIIKRLNYKSPGSLNGLEFNTIAGPIVFGDNVAHRELDLITSEVTYGESQETLLLEE